MVKGWRQAFRAVLPVVALLVSGWCLCAAQELSKTPLPAGLVARGAAAAPAAVVCFLEGPAVDAAGSVFFSDIAGNRILKMDAKGAVAKSSESSARTPPVSQAHVPPRIRMTGPPRR